MTLWYDGTVLQGYFVIMVLYYFGTMVLWYCGTVVLCYCGTRVLCTVVLWYYGTMVLWYFGNIVLGYNGSMVLRYCVKLGMTGIDTCSCRPLLLGVLTVINWSKPVPILLYKILDHRY